MKDAACWSMTAARFARRWRRPRSIPARPQRCESRSSQRRSADRVQSRQIACKGPASIALRVPSSRTIHVQRQAQHEAGRVHALPQSASNRAGIVQLNVFARSRFHPCGRSDESGSGPPPNADCPSVPRSEPSSAPRGGQRWGRTSEEGAGSGAGMPWLIARVALSAWRQCPAYTRDLSGA